MKGRFMRRSFQWTIILGVLLALTFGVAACGGGDDNGGNSEQGSSQGTPAKGKRGGKLTALWASDVDFIDPGIAYYQVSNIVLRATQSSLYLPKNDDPTTQDPILAESDPDVASDGCTVTVKIKKDVKFSPPVNRVVTSKDVKYAVERGFFNTVNNGYAGAYFGDLKGAKVGVKPGTTISGITTPDDQTIEFALKPKEQGKCAGGVLAGALVMPLTAPVPEEYAKKFDAKNPSTYGENQVATGPYMIANNASGKAVGYQAGRQIHLVRNPSWKEGQDPRPAYLDEIQINEGNDDATVMARKVLEGQSMINGDTPPPPAVLRTALQRQKDQIQLVPSGGGRWIALNMTMEPFNDLNVRRAISAGFDREALRLTRGGAVIGDIATHYLPPGMAGFEEAGGMKGPGFDFQSNPKPDMNLAAEYFKKAGYASGKYEGDKELLMVADNTEPGSKTAEVAKEQFERLGFKIRMRQVTHESMYTKFCNVPKADVAICPNVGWLKDFADPQTYLDPTFNGENILPANNSNWSQLNDKAVNEEMDKAKLLTDPAERAKAWAEIDKKITSLAPAINWIWDKSENIESSNVNGVIDEDNALWALAYTSLK
jgi:peptide/nickel transport system substrate-binding protein